MITVSYWLDTDPENTKFFETETEHVPSVNDTITWFADEKDGMIEMPEYRVISLEWYYGKVRAGDGESTRPLLLVNAIVTLVPLSLGLSWE